MMQNRWQEIQSIWQNNQVLYVIAGFLAGILFFPAIEALSADASELLSGFVPEAVGIAFTVLLIDRLYQSRERAREENEQKSKLVREVGSPDHATAVNALRELQARRWLYSGALKGANLEKADFSGVELWLCDLSESNLREAILRNARFYMANLSKCDLSDANLEGAELISSDLAGANLFRANLEGANLENANLCGTMLGLSAQDYLSYFNTSDSEALDVETAEQVASAGAFMPRFSRETTLPDGSKWTPKSDLRRFTDPNHPDFWEPDWVKAQRERGQE
jgi:hypothetical protein